MINFIYWLLENHGEALHSWVPIAAAAVGAAANFASQQGANSANAAEGHKNRAFQRFMSDTAHTREVADLKKAGLNPILSANSGASTPSGGQATMQAPQIDMPGILEAMTTQKTLDQNQQRINIDKANSAAGIAKMSTEADLNKTKRLVEQGGILSKYLGSNAGELVNKGKDTIMNLYKKSLMNNQPPKQGPSSGGADVFLQGPN